MIKNTTPHRPALAAIAAVLALSSTPVLAQVTLPADPAAPVAPSAPVAAPAPAVQAPVQTVQSVPATPALPDLPESAAAPVAAKAEPVTRRAAARTEAPKPAPRAEARAAAPPVQEAPATPAPMASAPAPAPVDVMPVEEAAAPTPAPAAAAPAPVASDASSPDYAAWALLGGGAVLVLGGAAFALSRRPKRRDEVVDYAVQDEAVAAAAPVAVHPAPLPAAPAKPVVAPVAARATPVAAREPVDMTSDSRRAALEAMVAEAPSEANPFHSRRNRLRRADFLLRTGQAEPRQGEYAMAQESASETAKDRWSEMRFQGGQKSRINWRPFRTN